jgi:CBS domain containing-hemolysin-like protein
MVPRVDMVTISSTEDVEHCLELVRKHGYSRYPLCEEGNPDRVIGYVHVKDLLTVISEEGRRLTDLKRDVLFVPESNTVGEVLSEFQLTSMPFGIVVDEYGGTSGLVTVEDVVEEMVGEIQDEHDAERPRVLTRNDGTVAVDGSVGLDEVELEGLDLEPIDGADTMGGYVVANLGRLARPGDRVRAGGWDLVVEDVRRRRISRLRLIPHPASLPPDAEAETPPPE